MKCSVCKNRDRHLTKVEKKLFCDQCKPDPMKVEFKAVSIKQEIDIGSDDISDSSSSDYSLQRKLKTEIDIEEDDATVDFADHSYFPVGIDDNAGQSNSSESLPIAKAAMKKNETAVNKVKSLKCHLCEYRCITTGSIRKHRKKFHPEISYARPIRCKICYRSFNRVSNLEKHIDEKHNGFGAKCKFCLEKLKIAQKLTHQRKCEGRHLFSCATCGKRYVKLESLRNHLDEHDVVEAQKDQSIVKTRTREQLFVCVICEEGVVYEEEPYWKHVKEQHDGHYLRCDDCGKTHKTSRSWFSHKSKYCKVGPARERFIKEEVLCPHCSKPCKSKASLERHMYDFHSKTGISCNECGINFHTNRAYHIHMKKIHTDFQIANDANKEMNAVSDKVKQLKCHLCDYSGINLRSIGHHHKKHHPEFYIGTLKQTIRCEICYQPFKGASNLDKHIDEEHGGFGSKCKFCLVKLKRDQRFTHQRQCEGQFLFSCGTCEKRYVKLESLRQHLNGHGVAETEKDLSIVKTRTREQLFVCIICEDDLVQEKDSYWKHVKDQHDGHYLRCEDCGKTFKHSHGVYNHKIRTCKVGPARERFISKEVHCPHCSKPCNSKAALEAHILYNHRETPLSCNECGMKFLTLGARRYHRETVHHLEPRFECTKCPKKFWAKNLFKQHLLSHERGTLECKICKITFKYHIVLANHIKLNHRPRETFECQQCSKRFTMRSHYTIHMKKIHGHDGKEVSS